MAVESILVISDSRTRTLTLVDPSRGFECTDSEKDLYLWLIRLPLKPRFFNVATVSL